MLGLIVYCVAWLLCLCLFCLLFCFLFVCLLVDVLIFVVLGVPWLSLLCGLFDFVWCLLGVCFWFDAADWVLCFGVFMV